MGTWVLTLTKTGTTESCAAGRVPWPVLGLVADVAKSVGVLLQLHGVGFDGEITLSRRSELLV